VFSARGATWRSYDDGTGIPGRRGKGTRGGRGGRPRLRRSSGLSTMRLEQYAAVTYADGGRYCAASAFHILFPVPLLQSAFPQNAAAVNRWQQEAPAPRNLLITWARGLLSVAGRRRGLGARDLRIPSDGGGGDRAQRSVPAAGFQSEEESGPGKRCGIRGTVRELGPSECADGETAAENNKQAGGPGGPPHIGFTLLGRVRWWRLGWLLRRFPGPCPRGRSARRPVSNPSARCFREPPAESSLRIRYRSRARRSGS
jgi:hypothetical protein